jgi:hypothetical protein
VSDLPPGPSERVIDFDGRDQERDAAQAQEVELRKARRKAFLQRMLTDPAGRDWLWSLLVDLNAFGTTFGISPGGFPDPLATQYHLGRRSAGWRIWTEMDDESPELASLMRREHS